ncbi:sulfatase family protein [Aestuariivivens insulae]|uniref:sulfatase family protein n=1 Tax=Aestuariivivens insulae TaxID=1621988 RepID=UPI001F568528|nr:sulfatase [Aestuariivivens insulae]
MKIYTNILKTLLVAFLLLGCKEEKSNNRFQIEEERPNFLILMSDNHSYNHLGCYGDEIVKTPNIDKVAKEGVLFSNAYCNSPSCSPARAAMLTGQDAWRLQDAANLWGGFPKAKVYTELMKEAGYHVGIEGKGWGPGNAEVDGWEHNPGGEEFNSFEEFYNEIEKGQPWMYWYSSRDPHRPFKRNGWKKSGIDLDKIVVPPYLPDTEEVRKDIADYYNEVQNFDKEVSSYMALVNEMGELENTIVIICSDNGWQMPRGLANLYDFGTKVPLIIWAPKHFKGNRSIDDFVSLNDFAPTFLELSGIDIPKEMNAKSIANILESDKSGQLEKDRDFVVMGRERHAFVREGGKGYPGRAIRTKEYLYIKNYEPNRWPAGDPPLYGDVDAHMLQYPAPTKFYMLENEDDPAVKPLFELAFGKRPGEELYDLIKDPDQMNNVAELPEYKQIKEDLSKRLVDYLVKSGDPRETDEVYDWDAAPYYMEGDKTPRPGEEAIEKLGLKEEYSYMD